MNLYIPNFIKELNTKATYIVIAVAAMIGMIASMPPKSNPAYLTRFYDCGIARGVPNGLAYEFTPFSGLNSRSYKSVKEAAKQHGFTVIEKERDLGMFNLLNKLRTSGTIDLFYSDEKNGIIHLKPIQTETLDETVEGICNAMQQVLRK